MIEIRELRTKNWLNYLIQDSLDERKEWYEPTCLDAVDLLELEHNPETLKKWFQPIPFTTEWAERFHLIGSVINGFCIAPSEHKGHDYDLCLYDEHTWDSERKVLCPINSVHHCQNLFLDLANHILE